jgi:DNA repair exonuclease SbcCD ATPase subunit
MPSSVYGKRPQGREIGAVCIFEVSFFQEVVSMKTLVRLAVLAVFLFTGTLVYCQQTQTAPAGAGDSALVRAAKKERERREKLNAATKPKKSFTNQDIEDFKARNKDAEKSAEGEEGATDESSTTTEETTTPNNDAQEKEWREKSHAANERIKNAEQKLEKLQSDINALTQAFYAESDGVSQRGQIEEQRNNRLNELEKAKKELDDAKQAQEDLREDARKQGALPGWIEEQ